MPFFLFQCTSGHQIKKLLALEDARKAEISCEKPECQLPMKLTVGTPSALAKETTDEYRGKSYDMGLKEKLTERQRQNFKEHDLPRVIQKEGKEEAIRRGLIDREGRVKPKG